jgi:hypothetical protein
MCDTWSHELGSDSFAHRTIHGEIKPPVFRMCHLRALSISVALDDTPQSLPRNALMIKFIEALLDILAPILSVL